MRFWDSSALVPLLLDEADAPDLRPFVHAEAPMVLWWATQVECTSAIARREREGALDLSDANDALSRLRTVAMSAAEVSPTEAVRLNARRLLRTHPLRAADALQLAAALAVAEDDPGALEFLCLDDRLKAAAAHEGFPVLP